jgi:hypothetical protein
MKPQLLSNLRSGLIALGVLAGLSAPTMAGPAGYMAPPAQPGLTGVAEADADAAARPTLVGWVCTYGNRCRDSATGAFRTRAQIKGNSHVLDGVRRGGNRRNWDNGGNWNNGNWNNGWNDDRRWKKRRYARRHYNRGPNIVLGLGFGIPAYRYADPYYYDYNYVAPRRVYRRSYGLSEAHIAWCFDRWRSYRAYDNTYQPYYGPRKLCWSPYS